jgi:hypothetical protein
MMTSAAWGAFHPVVLLYRTRSTAWSHPVELHHYCSYDQGWSAAGGGWQLHCSRLLTHYVSLTGHCSTCQARGPLTGHCSTCHARVPWEHMSLATRLCQRRLPLHLRLTTLREPQDTLLHWSPPKWGERVWSCGTHGSTGALLSREVGSGAAGHVTAQEPSSAGRQGSEPQDMWQHVVARPAPCLGLMPVCGGTQSTGYQQLLKSSLAVWNGFM